MTTYSYRLIFDDSEVIMLEAALKMMIDKCDKELESAKEKGEDPKAPFWAFKDSAEKVLQKLDADTELASFSKF